MKRIVYTGDKQIYELKTREGFVIKSSEDHRFFTNRGWMPLKELYPEDCVAISDLSNRGSSRLLGKGTHKIKQLWTQLKANNLCALCGTTRSLEVHHKDEDYKNNNLDNLEVLCWECHHLKRHDKRPPHPNKFKYRFDKIVSITKLGVEDCYDIEMEGGESLANFIANGFVVHNCKHTVLYTKYKANQFYVFDVWNNQTNTWWDYDHLSTVMDTYGLYYIKRWAELEFPKLEQLEEFLKHSSEFGAEQIEGIVLKRYDFVNKFGHRSYAKLVNEKFKEVHDSGKKTTLYGTDGEFEKILTQEGITNARVEKVIHKLVDEVHNGDVNLLSEKDTSRVIETVFSDWMCEELYNAVRKNRKAIINFGVLGTLMKAKAREYFFDFLRRRGNT